MNYKTIHPPSSCVLRAPARVVCVPPSGSLLGLPQLRASLPSSLFRTLTCLLVVACCSCGDDEPKVRVRTIPGTIMKIDTANRRLTLRYLHEKSGVHREVEGDVLPDTEIFINGKLSPLSDLKIGERAVIQGRIEKTATSTKIYALKIDVTRDESVSFNDDPSSSGP